MSSDSERRLKVFNNRNDIFRQIRDLEADKKKALDKVARIQREIATCERQVAFCLDAATKGRRDPIEYFPADDIDYDAALASVTEKAG